MPFSASANAPIPLGPNVPLNTATPPYVPPVNAPRDFTPGGSSSTSGGGGGISDFFHGLGLGGNSKASFRADPTQSANYQDYNPDSRTPPGPRAIHQDFMAHITGRDENAEEIDVAAPIPEQVALDVSSHFSALFSQGNPVAQISHAVGGNRVLSAIDQVFNGMGAINTVAQDLLGYSGLMPSMTAQIWRSATPVTIHLPLVFTAITDVQTDVYDPVSRLVKLPLPSARHGILKNPGHNFFGYNSAYDVNVYLGNSLVFSNVTVTQAIPRFITNIDRATGRYQSAMVDLVFSTTTMATKEIVQAIFDRQTTKPSTAFESMVSNAREAVKTIEGAWNKFSSPQVSPSIPSSQSTPIMQSPPSAATPPLIVNGALY